MDIKSISTQTLRRLPLYLNYLKSLPKDSPKNISAKIIADNLSLNDVQVRKDLAQVSSGGKPRIGYIKLELIKDLERFLGYDDVNNAILIGAGNLGSAILSYTGFEEFGLNIVAAFDHDEMKINSIIGGKKIFSMTKIEDLCKRLKVKIAIITVPVSEAQNVCDIAINCGITAIWNFAPTFIKVPSKILLQHENMAASLSVLSNHLSKIMTDE